MSGWTMINLRTCLLSFLPLYQGAPLLTNIPSIINILYTVIHFMIFQKEIGGRVQILDGTFHWQDKRKMEIRWKSWLDSSLFPSGWSIDKMEKQLMTYLIGLCIKTYKKLFTVWWSSLRMRSDPVRPYEVLTTMPPCLWSVTPAKFIVV